MAARGDLVGDAYVRIHADSRFMRRAIERDTKAIGKKGAQSFLRNFDRTIKAESDKILRTSQLTLARTIASGDWDALFKKSGLTVSGFVDEINADLNRIAGKKGAVFNDLKWVLEGLEKWAKDAAIVEHWEEVSRAEKKAAEDAKKFAEEAAKIAKDSERETKRIADAYARVARDEPRRVKEMTKSLASLSAALDKNNVNVNVNKDLLRRHNVNVKALSKELAKADSHTSKYSQTLEDFALRLDRTGGAVGRVFGKGSRNDAVNFFGSLIGGFTKLIISGGGVVHLFSSMASKVSGLLETFRALQAQGTSVGTALIQTFGGAASTGVIGLTVAVAGLAIVLQTLVFSVTTVAAALSMLAGAAVAAASAISFGIVGALLPLLPLLLSLAPAIQTFTSVWKKLSADVKDQTPEVKKLSKAWGEIGKALDPIADKIITTIATISPALIGFWKPLVLATGEAVARVIEDFGGIFTDPAMKGFLKVWQDTLPRLFESLGHTIVDLTAGFIAFFTPILEYSKLFAEALGGIAQDFRTWAASAEGQNAIQEFMILAWESAKTLWDIVKNLAVSIGEIFMSGETTGQGFLQYLSDVTARFSEWLKTEEGQATMRQFWADVKNFAKEGKDLIAGLFELFDKLDTAQSRKQISLIVGVLASMASGIASIITWLGQFEDKMLTVGVVILRMLQLLNRGFMLWFGTVTWVLQGIVTAAAIAFGWIPGIGEKLQVAAGRFSTFRTSANQQLAKIDKSLTIAVSTAEAMQKTKALQKEMANLHDKTVVVTVKGQVVGTGAGRAILGGQVMQSGGVLTRPTHVLAGEAGPEAVVPLNRPLSMVDPAVRALSAFAQGLPYLARGGLLGGGRSVNISPGAITVNSPAANPEHVAMSVIDQITASVY